MGILMSLMVSHDKDAELQPPSAAAVFDVLDEPVSIFRLDGTYVYVNAAGARLLGRSKDELIGRTYLALYPELVAHPFHAAFERVASGLATIERLEFYYAPMALWSSQRLCRLERFVVVYWEDVTARVLAQQALDSALAREREARATAESASRAKDQFMAMLSHELRNPLAPIVTSLHLMKLRDPSAFERERSTIERQVKHLVRLVDDLLDVSKFTSGKVELTRAPTELAEVIAAAVEIASPLIEQRRHHLAVNVPAGLIVDGDAHRLAQVVSNLLTNAARYTPAGGRIVVTAERRGDELMIEVRDNGNGIPATLLPHVFDLFVQGPQTLNRPTGGLGLGLTIVRQLVALHGGRVAASSEGPGLGATFSVHLPACDRQAAESVPPPRSGIALGVGRRVLVVDDNDDTARTLAELFTSLGFTARTAEDGPTALVLLDEFTPDVAVLDIGLPVMDGYELARRIRERGGSVAPQLIAVTGYAQLMDRGRSIAAGFDGHLVKPVDIVELSAMLRAFQPAAGG